MSQQVEVGLASDTFVHLADKYRRERLAHCYRMLGSVEEAEDLVQETYLRAWRSYESFEGRSSLRTWLHQIATRACLTALERRDRRPLPSGLGAPADDPEAEIVSGTEIAWLQPMPDVLLDGTDPAAVVESRYSLRLAFVAALQYLPPRQRAVLILRDVLAWRSAEVADLLGTTTVAVNSTLQRARAQLDLVAPAEDAVVKPTDPHQRQLLDRYVKAFESFDMSALEHLLKEDARWEMPPIPTWFVGRSAILKMIEKNCPAGPDDNRLVPILANGQPAFGLYLRAKDGVRRAWAIHVLTLVPDGISSVVTFMNPALFPHFGLPEVYPGTVPTPW